MPVKYIVVLGSLLSGLGKGIVSSSIVKVLSLHGIGAMPLKFDGYLNYDCGTMNPFKHGEVFVMEDSSEVDMDFGSYERFLNRDLNGSFSMTGGKILSEIIAKERRGDYLGSDVQIIPHLTNLIIEKVEAAARENSLDVMVIEVGGTAGDIENSYFIEAMRQLSMKSRVVFVEVTYVPELEVVGEQKTKPTQIAIRSLMQVGIQPSFIVTRSSTPLSRKAREKIAMFSNLSPERVIDNSDIPSIYSVPERFLENGFCSQILKDLEMDAQLDIKALESWKECVRSMQNGKREARIAVVGKYVDLKDSYASVKEAIVHAAASMDAHAEIDWVESSRLEDGDAAPILKGSDGIIVPGGFGKRGTEGMINAIRHARENRVPYLGLCLGMQMMAVEFARNVARLDDAHSSEFKPDAANRIIHIMESQKGIEAKGGTMRLGAWAARVAPGTYAMDAYKAGEISERHRHRYEFNNDYRELLDGMGLRVSATTLDGSLVEMLEWKGSFGIGTQAHPELKSRPERPAPLFVEFMRRALERRQALREPEHALANQRTMESTV